MATAWAGLTAQGESNTASVQVAARTTCWNERAHRSRMRSVSQQMNMAIAADAPRSGRFDFKRLQAPTLALIQGELAAWLYRHRAERVPDRGQANR